MAKLRKPSGAPLVDVQKKEAAGSRHVRMYVDMDMREPLDRLVAKAEGDMRETELCQLLLRAALRAVAKNNYRISVPLVLRVVEPDGTWPALQGEGYGLNDAGKKTGG